MTSRNNNKLRVDDVTEGDFSQVAGTFFPESLLRDYVDLAAKDQSLRCLLLRKKVTILGFVVLVFKRPVSPQNNPRALSFYRNMGFKAIGAPHHIVWEITDSSLITHRGENTLQTMVKVLQ